MRAFILCLAICFSSVLYAQNNTGKKPLLYHPEENAAASIEEAVKKAKAENKQVFIQAGGNWCSWCIAFNRFTHANASIDSLLKADYIVYHLNYSKENKNEKIFEQYKFPQRFGFPVFLILNDKGELIHTQNSSYLEAGKSYDKEKVLAFLKDWDRAALNPDAYKN
ncbi:MAG: thioredoxin family protein [Chitinophagaceae bacterium]|nr:thioredoxin family protein [Chitinophagaceae bacterium]